MLDMCNMFSSESSILKSLSTDTETFERMHQKNITYADVLKNKSGYLNHGMNPTPLIPKAPRVHLSEEAKSKLRSIILEKACVESGEQQKVNKSVITEMKSEKQTKTVKRGAKKEVTKPLPVTNCS